MRLCLDSFVPPLDRITKGTASWVRELGFSVVGVDLEPAVPVDANACRAVRETLEEEGVSIGQVWSVGTPLVRPDRGESAAHLQVLRDRVPLAAALGCRVLLTEGRRHAPGERLVSPPGEPRRRSAGSPRRGIEGGRAFRGGPRRYHRAGDVADDDPVHRGRGYGSHWWRKSATPASESISIPPTSWTPCQPVRCRRFRGRRLRPPGKPHREHPRQGRGGP